MSKLDRLDPATLIGNPRATLPAWLKYESLALQCYLAYPGARVWEPTNHEASTVVTRLRDAIRGCLAFRHPINEAYEVTHEDLLSWYGKVIFKTSAGRIYVGPQDKVLAELRGHTVGSAEERKGLNFPSLDFEEVNAFMLLLSRGRLVGPIIVTSPPDITLLMDRPNVEAVTRPDGSLLIL